MLRFAVISLLSCVHATSGSVLTFKSSPQELKQGLTQTLTLTCALSDSAPSTSIIGRRDVTQTADNVLMLTSLVLTRAGLDLASVNSALPAHVMSGATNVKVSGHTSGRTGVLELTISQPTVNQTGDFVCEANAVTSTGHGVILSSSLEVTSSEPSVADLVTFVSDLSQKVQDLDKKNAELEKKTSELDKKNADLEQAFLEFKNRSEAMVFFNAGIIARAPHYTSGQEVVFDLVKDDKGNDYDSSDGHFTCVLPGYYHFSVSCLTQTGKAMGLELLHNGGRVFIIYGDFGHGYQSAANTATLQLHKGDVVNVRTDRDSYLNSIFCSFSGHLIEAL